MFLYVFVYVDESFNSSVNVCSRNVLICNIIYPLRLRLRQLLHIPSENSYSFEDAIEGVCVYSLFSHRSLLIQGDVQFEITCCSWLYYMYISVLEYNMIVRIWAHGRKTKLYSSLSLIYLQQNRECTQLPGDYTQTALTHSLKKMSPEIIP